MINFQDADARAIAEEKNRQDRLAIIVMEFAMFRWFCFARGYKMNTVEALNAFKEDCEKMNYKLL